MVSKERAEHACPAKGRRPVGGSLCVEARVCPHIAFPTIADDDGPAVIGEVHEVFVG